MTVAIVGIIATVAPSLLVGVKNFYLTVNSRNDIQRDARASLDMINRTLRQAKISSVLIDSGTNGSSARVSTAGPYSRIRFRRADNMYCEFRQEGSQLKQVIGTNTSILSRNLVYLAFTFPRTDDPSLLSVSMTMGKSVQLGQQKVLELTLQKIRLMNP